MGGSRDPCDPLRARDEKWTVRGSDIVSLPKLVMVERDHGTDGPVVAFFNESISRDTMTGTKTVFALCDAN